MTNANNTIETSKSNNNVIFALNPFTGKFEKFATIEEYCNNTECNDSPIVNGVQYKNTTELEKANVLTIETELSEKEIKAIAKYVKLNGELVELNEDLDELQMKIYDGLDKGIRKDREKGVKKLQKSITKIENKMDKITDEKSEKFMETLNEELGGSYFSDYELY